MLRVYSISLEVIRELRPVLDRVSQRDADLARQMRRALTSVPLNIAEGSASRGRNRAARYHTAAGSMREVMATIEVAEALGYVVTLNAALVEKMRQIVGTLIINARG